MVMVSIVYKSLLQAQVFLSLYLEKPLGQLKPLEIKELDHLVQLVLMFLDEEEAP